MKDKLEVKKEVLNLSCDPNSEDEDEDYVPKNESDDEDFGMEGKNGNCESNDVSGSRLDIGKRKRVDDAFDALFGITSNKSPSSSLTMPSKINKKMKKARKMKRALKKKKRVLTDLFGSSQAQKLLTTSAFATNESQKKTRGESHLPKLERKTIIEVKKFAGQQIEIKKVVEVEADLKKRCDIEAVTDIESRNNGDLSESLHKSNIPNSASTTEKRLKPIGIDSVLSKLSKSDNISTLVKSNADWDLFKDKSGLEKDLEKNSQGKNAYLVKQDFLHRVDERKFEHEKEERDRKRRARIISNSV